jgi:mannose/fructose/N-acetylgalactosamine-specific phosphotransferase system component IID
MAMLRAGLAVAAMFIGAIAALLGVIVVLSALNTGAVQFSYGHGADSVSETVSRATDAARYWRLVTALGFAPAVIGALAARWGWRTIDR